MLKEIIIIDLLYLTFILNNNNIVYFKINFLSFHLIKKNQNNLIFFLT